MVLSFLVCQLGLILLTIFKEKLSHLQNDNTATNASTAWRSSIGTTFGHRTQLCESGEQNKVLRVDCRPDDDGFYICFPHARLYQDLPYP